MGQQEHGQRTTSPILGRTDTMRTGTTIRFTRHPRRTAGSARPMRPLSVRMEPTALANTGAAPVHIMAASRDDPSRRASDVRLDARRGILVMIKRDEAKRRILAEWPSWSATQATPTLGDGILFFSFLQRERSHLLEFRASGDKWQHVHRPFK